MTRTCENPSCGKSFTPRREHGRFCSDDCRYEAWDQRHPRIKRDIRTTDEAHPLQAVRDEQAERKHNRDFGGLIRQAIVDRIKTAGTCHADDLEDLYPAEQSEHARCRKLAGAQFGSLASPSGGGPLIREKERRKSTVPERKGAKSTVWEFTKAGWDRYATVGLGGGNAAGLLSSGSAASGNSPQPGKSQPGGDATTSPAPPPGATPDVGGEALSLLPEPPNLTDPDQRRAA